MLNGEHTSGALARPSLQVRGSLCPRGPALFVAHDDPEVHVAAGVGSGAVHSTQMGAGWPVTVRFVERSEETLPAVAKKLNTFGGSSGPTGTGSRRTTSLGEIVPPSPIIRSIGSGLEPAGPFALERSASVRKPSSRCASARAVKPISSGTPSSRARAIPAPPSNAPPSSWAAEAKATMEGSARSRRADTGPVEGNSMPASPGQGRVGEGVPVISLHSANCTVTLASPGSTASAVKVAAGAPASGSKTSSGGSARTARTRSLLTCDCSSRFEGQPQRATISEASKASRIRTILSAPASGPPEAPRSTRAARSRSCTRNLRSSDGCTR